MTYTDTNTLVEEATNTTSTVNTVLPVEQPTALVEEEKQSTPVIEQEAVEAEQPETSSVVYSADTTAENKPVPTTADTQAEDKPTPEFDYEVVDKHFIRMRSPKTPISNVKMGIDCLITDDPNPQQSINILHEGGQQFKCKPADIVYNYKKLAESMINAGCSVYPDDPKEMRLMLTFLQNEAQDPTSEIPLHKHEIVGWKQVNGKWCYLGVDGVGINSTYSGSMAGLEKAGTLEGWVDAVNKFIAPREIPSITMAASFAGIIRQKLSKLGDDYNLLINLSADSSHGKTTLTQACYSIYGEPAGVISYNGTINERHDRLVQRGPMVSSIDDILRMPELEGKQGKQLGSKLCNLVFRIASGTNKGRLSSQNQMQDSRVYHGTVLTSTTTPLMPEMDDNVGQAVRLIELKLSEKYIITKSGAEAEQMLQAFEANHGHAAEAFARGVLSSSDKEIMEHLDMVKQRLSFRLAEHRMTKRYSLIILCAELCNEFLGTQFNTTAMSDFLVDLGNSLIQHYEDEASKFDIKLIEKKVLEYLQNHKDSFHKGSIEGVININKYLGTYEVKGGKLILKLPILTANTSINKDSEQPIIRDDVLPYILTGTDPEELLNPESMENLSQSDDSYTDIKKCLREKHILNAKDKGFYKLITLVKGKPQINGIQLHLDPSVCEGFNLDSFK